MVMKQGEGTSLAIQWLRLHTSSAGGGVSFPGRGTKIPHVMWRGQKKRNRREEGGAQPLKE